MRTGTASLRTALEKLLGGECYHMQTVAKNPSHAEFWIKACDEEITNQEWRQFFKHYTAAVDFPPVAFYERLMDIYPKAKLVLTTRDPDKWFVSVKNTIAPFLKRMSTFPRSLFSRNQLRGKMIKKVLRKRFGFDIFHQFHSENCMTKVYRYHIEEVLRIVPPDRLLVFRAKDGWGPLCDFLDLPEPNEPYPWENTTQNFNARSVGSLSPMWKMTAGLVLLFAIAVAIFIRLFMYLQYL